MEKHELRLTYYEDNLTKKSEANYYYGKCDGENIEYYRDGSVSRIQHYKNGLRNGKYYEYYEDGSIGQERNYSDGVEHGVCINYYKNGTKESEYNYKMENMMVCV